ncbi:MAG: sulfite exporter TauE/SafE family protein [Beijerinckiaceae bacterium]|jgi:uncharacterized membrane protein YfcA
MIDDWVFYAFAIPSVILLGLGKGGFSGLGLLSFPLMALVAPPIQAAAIILPILMVQDLVGVWAFRREFDRENLKLMAPGALAGLVAGFIFAKSVSNGAILFLVGLISVAFVIWQALGARRGASAPAKPARGPASFWGLVCGFTSFIANAGGPPFQVYMLPQRLPPRLYAGTSTMFFTAVNYLKFPAFFQLGQMNAGNLLTSAVLFPLAIASVSAGIWMVRRISAQRFYPLVLGLTLAVGLKLIWDGASQLLAQA